MKKDLPKRPHLSTSVAKRYFKQLEAIEERFSADLMVLEAKMEKETGIKGIEFFWSDNSIVGIGNEDRTLKLIHRGF